MVALKGTTDKIAGKTKEAVAEIIGDGKLREEGKAQQRSAKPETKTEPETNEPGEPDPLRPLNKLT